MEELEIVSHLNAKTINRFKLVCKHWREFLTEEFFIKKQFSNMVSKGIDTVIVQPDAIQSLNDEKLHVFSIILPRESSPNVSPKVMDLLAKSGKVLSSKGGLVCCRSNKNDEETSFFVCNPANRSWSEIYTPRGIMDSNSDVKVVLDFENGSKKDDFSLNYKLMVFKERTDSWKSTVLQCRIYSGAEKRWKDGWDVECGARNIMQMPVSSNGIVYFTSDSFPCYTKTSPHYWPYLVAYEPKMGTSKILKLPKNARKGVFASRIYIRDARIGVFASEIRAFEWEDTICLVQLKKDRVCCWVLEDYCSGSWTRILKKRFKTMGITESDPVITGFAVFNSKFLLLATEERFYRYDLTTDDDETAEDLCQNPFGTDVGVIFQPYSSTLCPCGDGEKSMLI